MLFALLFDEKDQLVAAAPAPAQHPMGDAFWRDIYPQMIPINHQYQTAQVEVKDAELTARLLSLATDDQHLEYCRSGVESLVLGEPNPKESNPSRAA